MEDVYISSNTSINILNSHFGPHILYLTPNALPDHHPSYAAHALKSKPQYPRSASKPARDAESNLEHILVHQHLVGEIAVGQKALLAKTLAHHLKDVRSKGSSLSWDPFAFRHVDAPRLNAVVSGRYPAASSAHRVADMVNIPDIWGFSVA